MDTSSTTVTAIVPQLSSWSHSDVINAVIAGVAIATLIITTVFNLRSNRLAVLAINRQERIKLYLPVIALIGGTWVKMDTEILQIRMGSFDSPFAVDEGELADLQKKILNLEFDALEEMIGSPKLRQAIDKIFIEINAALSKLREIIIQDHLLETGQASTIQDYVQTRDQLLIELTNQSSGIQNEIKKLRSLAAKEFSTDPKWKK